MLRRQMNDEEKQLRKENGKKVKAIQAQDLCPSCYNMQNGGLYAENKNRIVYEDCLVQCFLEEYPRTPGHTIILVKQHYEDISEMPLFIGTQVIQCSKAIVNSIKEVLGAKKVYMCTMCDGERNHLHFQLIPRYEDDIIGSKLFVKERGIFVDDTNLVVDLRKRIKLYLDPDTDYTEPNEEFYRYNGEQNRRVISEILKREEKYIATDTETKKEEKYTSYEPERKEEKQYIPEEPKDTFIEKDIYKEQELKKEETKIAELEKAAARTYSEEKNEYLKNLEISNKENLIAPAKGTSETEDSNKKCNVEDEVENKINEALKDTTNNAEEDPILNDAIEYVIKNRIASPNAIQKKFEIGYFRAVKLIEEMENKGIVSSYNKVTRKRDVLVKGASDTESTKSEIKETKKEDKQVVSEKFVLDIEKVSEKIKEKIEEIDPIFEEVLDFCVESKKFELIDIQTEFTIGYTRALSIYDSLKCLEIISEKTENDKTTYIVLINENQAYTLKEILKEKREEKALEYIEEEQKNSVETINYFSNKNYVDGEINNIEIEKEEPVVEDSYITEMKKRDPKDIVNKIFEEYKQSQDVKKEDIIEKEIEEELEEIKENKDKGSIKFEVTDNRKTEIITVEDTTENAKKEEIENEEIEETIKKETSLKDKKEKIKQIIGNAFTKKEDEDVKEDIEVQETENDELPTEEYLKNELNKLKEDAIQDEEISKIEENINKNFDMITSKIQNEEMNDLSEKIDKIDKYLEEDELLKDAIEEAIDSNNASATFMQRKLRITYVRAIRLLDMMQDVGVINKFVAGEPRRVLLTYKEWLEIKQTLNLN